VGERTGRSELHQPPAVGTALLHLARQEARHVALRHPHRELPEGCRHGGLRDLDGAADQGDFLGGLDHAQPLGDRCRVHELPAGQRGRKTQ
jgi:hypothetical protein